MLGIIHYDDLSTYFKMKCETLKAKEINEFAYSHGLHFICLNEYLMSSTMCQALFIVLEKQWRLKKFCSCKK